MRLMYPMGCRIRNGNGAGQWNCGYSQAIANTTMTVLELWAICDVLRVVKEIRISMRS